MSSQTSSLTTEVHGHGGRLRRLIGLARSIAGVCVFTKLNALNHTVSDIQDQAVHDHPDTVQWPMDCSPTSGHLASSPRPLNQQAPYSIYNPFPKVTRG